MNTISKSIASLFLKLPLIFVIYEGIEAYGVTKWYYQILTYIILDVLNRVGEGLTDES